MKEQIKAVALSVAVSLLIAACAGTAEQEGMDAAGGEGADGAVASGLRADELGDLRELEGAGRDAGGEIKPVEALEQSVVYFAFDSAVVDSEYMDVIRDHANYLLDHPEASVTLSGHTDERGSREYNIALGERRAESVKRLLLARGVSAQQVNVVSYGEEKPAVAGHGEEAWSKNRRVAFNYR